ncbi:MAG: NUDIX domain-containing protein [Candidatus Kerfeldbacteria bacterium]|nr:NUDIX domain-containing protein [Candidatus Kerfeldbacteria bacterium]
MPQPIPVPNISLNQAKPEKLFYFVATGTVYRDGKCLILQRAANQVAHPSVWGPVGGKLEHKDLKTMPPTRMNGDVTDWEHMVESLLIREAKEESGLDVYDFRYLDSVVFVRPDGTPVVCVKYGCRAKPGEVVMPKDEFQAFAWVDGNEVDQYSCILGVPDEVRKTISLLSGK